MKKYIVLLFFSVMCVNLSAQYEDFKVEVSGGGGVLSRGSGKKGAGYGFVAADLTYYYSDSYGFFSGVTRVGSFDAVDAVWEVPLYFTHRGGVAKRSDKTRVGGQAHSTNEAGWGFLSFILPTRFDWYVGSSLGYYQGERNLYSKQGLSGFEIRNRIGFSIDAEARFYYVFGRVKLSISPMLGYLFTSNVVYAGDGSTDLSMSEKYDGMTPHIRFRVKGGLAFSF